MKDNLVQLDGVWIPAGHCPTQCEGFNWGPTCNKKCPDNCRRYEDKASCYKDSGECLKCQDKAWRGVNCDTPCHEGCADGRCWPVSGECESGCKAGYWNWPPCDMKCNENCIGQSCDKDGTCNLGCKPGFWLADCSQPCPDGTVNECGKTTGMPYACSKNGVIFRYPAFVQNEDVNIVYTNVLHADVDVNAGAPATSQLVGQLSAGARVFVTEVGTDGATPRLHYTTKIVGTGPGEGWVTQKTTGGMMLMRPQEKAICQECPANCYDGECDSTGKCTQGCAPGSFGEKCDQPCPSGCSEAGCDQIHAGAAQDGQCQGCLPGFTGTKCSDPCHFTCQTCKQRGGGIFGRDAHKDDCTSCHEDQPMITIPNGQAGPCTCMPGSNWDEAYKVCSCDEPPASELNKQAYFQVRPYRACRWVCKTSGDNVYVEVHGDKKSACIKREQNQAVMKVFYTTGHFEQGGCNTLEYEIALAAEPNGKFCLLREYVGFITGES